MKKKWHQWNVFIDIKTPGAIVVDARTKREAILKAKARLIRRGLRKKDLDLQDVEEGPDW